MLYGVYHASEKNPTFLSSVAVAVVVAVVDVTVVGVVCYSILFTFIFSI